MKKFNEILTELKYLLKKETEIGFEILKLLEGIEEHREYRALGYASLFSFCTEELKMSESQTYTRITAMREMKKNPDLEERLKTGEIKPSQVTETVRVFRRVQEETGEQVSKEKRAETFEQISNQTRQETKKTLNVLFQEHLPQTEKLAFEVSKDLKNQFEEFKAYASHKLKNQSNEEALALLIEIAMKNVNPKDKSEKTEIQSKTRPSENSKPDAHSKITSTSSTFSIQVKAESSETKQTAHSQRSVPIEIVLKSHEFPEISSPFAKKSHSRYIPKQIQRITRARSQDQCEYTDSATKRRCQEKHFLQFEHITPFSKGGSSKDSENIAHYCGVHNRMMWERHS